MTRLPAIGVRGRRGGSPPASSLDNNPRPGWMGGPAGGRPPVKGNTGCLGMIFSSITILGDHHNHVHKFPFKGCFDESIPAMPRNDLLESEPTFVMNQLYLIWND